MAYYNRTLAKIRQVGDRFYSFSPYPASSAGEVVPSILESIDGKTWGEFSGQSILSGQDELGNNFFYGVLDIAGTNTIKMLLAVNDSTIRIIKSTDGTNFEELSSLDAYISNPENVQLTYNSQTGFFLQFDGKFFRIDGDGKLIPDSRYFDLESILCVARRSADFIRVLSDGTISTSTDAENWTIVGSIPLDAPGNTPIVEFVNGNIHASYSSGELIVITPDGSSNAFQPPYRVYGSTFFDGSSNKYFMLAVDGINTSYVQETTDFVSWTVHSIPADNSGFSYYVNSLMLLNGSFYLNSGRQLYQSSDLQVWTLVLSAVLNVSNNGNVLLALRRLPAGNGWQYINKLFTSVDGVNWDEVQFGTPLSSSLEAFSVNGHFVFVEDTATQKYIHTSANGSTWSASEIPTPAISATQSINVSCINISYENRVAFLVSNMSEPAVYLVYTEDMGQTWNRTPLFIGEVPAMYIRSISGSEVLYAREYSLFGGSTDEGLTALFPMFNYSLDGQTWLSAQCPSDVYMNEMFHDGERFVWLFLGWDGVMSSFTSTDLMVWDALPPVQVLPASLKPRKFLCSYNGRMYVAVTNSYDEMSGYTFDCITTTKNLSEWEYKILTTGDTLAEIWKTTNIPRSAFEISDTWRNYLAERDGVFLFESVTGHEITSDFVNWTPTIVEGDDFMGWSSTHLYTQDTNTYQIYRSSDSIQWVSYFIEAGAASVYDKRIFAFDGDVAVFGYKIDATHMKIDIYASGVIASEYTIDMGALGYELGRNIYLIRSGGVVHFAFRDKNDSQYYVMSSTDGYNWSVPTEMVGKVEIVENTFVNFDDVDGFVHHSTDGVNWQTINLPPLPPLDDDRETFYQDIIYDPITEKTLVSIYTYDYTTDEEKSVYYLMEGGNVVEVTLPATLQIREFTNGNVILANDNTSLWILTTDFEDFLGEYVRIPENGLSFGLPLLNERDTRIIGVSCDRNAGTTVMLAAENRGGDGE